jgi:hypothetical protein
MMILHPHPMAADDSPHEATDMFVDIKQVTGKMYSDQTGKFLAPSATGSNYVMIFYCYDSNSINAEPIKNRTAGKLKRAYSSTIVELLKSRGLHPKLQILDNEASKLLVDYIIGQERIDYQLAPPLYTGAMPQNVPLAPTKTILSLDFAAPTRTIL